MTYEQIEQANAKLSSIQLGTGSKKKDYVMVPERVKAFRMLYPDGYIRTDILQHDGKIVTMQAVAGYYTESGENRILATGLAQEEKGKGLVNGTSYIENCETSAVGRALGFLALGIDGGGICSAEELVNAITAQRQNEDAAAIKGGATNAATTYVTRVPPTPEEAKNAAAYILKKKRDLEAEYPDFNFMQMRRQLIDDGIIPELSSDKTGMDDAKLMMLKMAERLRNGR